MADSQPFRFLDLPKDIRFMVYGLLPLITRHHVVKVCGRGWHPERSVNIVSKRIPGISLIYTCRKIYAEARPLHRKIEEAKALHIIADWRSVGGAAMKAMLLCTSPNKCGDSPELAIILHPVGSCFSDRLKYPTMCNETHIFYRDYDTHDELYALLNHGTPLKPPLRIEIAVKCGEDLFGLEGQLEQYCREFYKWVASMRPPGLEWQVMDIVLRPMPICQYADNLLKMQRGYPFTDDVLTEALWQTAAWKCSVGEQVGLAEWKESWEEGGVKY
jgi:hypothetical protein